MGYHVKIAEIHNTSKQMIRQTDQWLHQLGRVRHSLAAVADTTAISGEGAEAMRAYIREVHIQALDWIVNTIEAFRSSLILYVDGYREIEPDSRGEISQDVLEEQLKRLQQGKYEFCETADCIEQILREVNQYMPIEGIAVAPVEACFDNALRYAEEIRSRVGEYEETHSHDLDSVEEMLHHIDGFLRRHVNAQIADITSYQPGTFARMPEYEKAQQLSEMHRSFVTMVSDRVREGFSNRDQRPAPVIIDATRENDIAIGNPVGLKFVAARGAFFKETVTGVPKLQGAGAVKIQEIAGQIRGGAIPQYVNHRALQNLGKRIVEEEQRANEQDIVPFAINEWLESYNVSSGCNGRVVAIPEERRLNWYAFEGTVGVNALKNKAENLNITVIESESGAVINEEGRYWICVGPRVLDADYPDDGRLWGDEFAYGTRVDVKIRNTQTGDISYIYAVVGDIRAHTYGVEGQGILHSGIPYPNSWNAEHEGSAPPDYSTVEFIRSADVENLKIYEILELIVYDE